ncbi:MAG TPA: FtsW/RodA/SpoVE family cell cycle protein [Bacteroidales bacterium]|nr:FtsW/RodA/SpoVE family cell cycle protein [Bacteroidales bacterium]
MAAVLKKYFKGDPVIWAVIFLLSVFSLLAVYSSTGSLAYKYQGGNTSYYILKHATILAMGIVITYITHLIPYKYFSRISQLLLVIAIPLLIVTLIYGVTRNQASRWLSVPGLSLTFQTSDIAKLAMVMYIARILAKKQDNIKDFREAFRPIIIPLALVCLLVLPANLSTAMLIFATAFILMFIGRINLKYLFGMIGITVILIGSFVAVALSNDWEGRIGTWKNRIESYVSSDSEESYQVTQAKIAIVSGGLVNLRPGKSIQRNFLPHPYSDFIYAIIIEEYGLTGGAILLALYLYLLFRAAVLVRKSLRTFPAFLAIGLAIMITFQALINMAVVVNLLPVTGQPLPMISMGGSSLLFTCVAFGIILSVSRGVSSQHEMEEKTENTDEEKTGQHGQEVYN